MFTLEEDSDESVTSDDSSEEDEDPLNTFYASRQASSIDDKRSTNPNTMDDSIKKIFGYNN